MVHLSSLESEENKSIKWKNYFSIKPKKVIPVQLSFDPPSVAPKTQRSIFFFFFFCLVLIRIQVSLFAVCCILRSSVKWTLSYYWLDEYPEQDEGETEEILNEVHEKINCTKTNQPSPVVPHKTLSSPPTCLLFHIFLYGKVLFLVLEIKS